MNEQMNIILEVLEEIKQQNRELTACVNNVKQPKESPSECENRKNIAGIAKILEEQLHFHGQFRKELAQVIEKLGQRIHEMKSGIAEVRISHNDAIDKLLNELQAKQSTHETKETKYYLFDVKRWAEWLIWGVLVVLLACTIGWAVYLRNANASLESYALCYRVLRMEQGFNSPTIAQLDSLFSSEDSADAIHQFRNKVSNYEHAIQRQAELTLQQQRLTEEQTSLSHQLQK